MVEKTRHPKPLQLVGGYLCLDFVNTRASHVDAAAYDYFRDYADVLDWALHSAQSIDASTARALAHAAREHPARARAAFARSRALREALYGIFHARAQRKQPARRDAAVLNEALREASAHRRLEFGAESVDWAWDTSTDLQRPLWDVAVSSAEVLANAEPARLRECPAPDGCGWVFYDATKNASRRWCSMRMCGNGAKMRRFLERRSRG